MRGPRDLYVLDLGCGKGPVSINIAKQLGYYCVGIDAIPEFIDQAIEKAKEYQISDLCTFRVGDIRHQVQRLQDFDIIILGSIGQVLGDYYTTLITLIPCLKADGAIIVDDGYIEDGSGFSHPHVLGKQELYRQVDAAEMIIIEEIRGEEDDELEENYDIEFRLIEKRCQELMLSYPEKATLFTDYVANQKLEYDHLKSGISTATLVIKRK